MEIDYLKREGEKERKKEKKAFSHQSSIPQQESRYRSPDYIS
jgi:hypothetical protein